MQDDVCVIIAAKDAAATIAAAVVSALAEAEVARVVVVDDGSSDGTPDRARSVDDGTGRLTVISLDRNYGPSFARNRALALCSERYIAILDADDFFLPGRFRRLLTEDGWDMIGDNIAFLRERVDQRYGPVSVPDMEPKPSTLSLEDFVLGNIVTGRSTRGDLGFLKPVMRAEFLTAHALAYDESLRLGEDYDLYVRALLAGARFKVIETCGYGAIVRSGSLSGRHTPDDLLRLADVDAHLLASTDLSASQRHALRVHERYMRARHDFSRFVDIRRSRSRAAAVLWLARAPRTWRAVVSGVVLDKFKALTGIGRKPAAAQSEPRFLFSPVQPQDRP